MNLTHFVTIVIFVSSLSAWTVQARAPGNGLVMLDVSKLENVTSKAQTDDEHLSFRELVNSGINGVHFRAWTFSKDKSYTQREWVEEAHEYGLWVCGGIGNTVDQMKSDGAVLASMGVDFIQLDEPMGKGLTESDYQAIKNSIHSMNPNCPVYITDVFYNSTIANWSSVDGIMQEIYVDQWYPDKLNEALSYKAGHPGQDVFMWVWLMTQHPDRCEAYPDSKFDTWFTDSFNKLGKVLLFMFNKRSYGDPSNCDNGTNWSARAQTIRASTLGLKKELPRWRNFSPQDPVDHGQPDCSVEVRSATVGLDPNSIVCQYSTDGGETWYDCPNVTCTGTKGTKTWVTVTAEKVPFMQISDSLNRIRFKITDTYHGDYYRGPRTDKKEYKVEVTSLKWSDFEPIGTVQNEAPNCSVKVRDAEHGIRVSTAWASFTTDGGSTWTSWPVECTGIEGSTDKETMTAKAVPFGRERGNLNRIKFGIETTSGEQLESPEYHVRVKVPPKFSSFSPTRTNNPTPDCTVQVQDQDGLLIGSDSIEPDIDTVLLLHLDSDYVDSSKNGYTAETFGNPKFVEIDTWKTGRPDEPALRFDGKDDYLDFGTITLNSQQMTLAAWVKAENQNEAIVYGGVEEQGSIYFTFHDNKVVVHGRVGKENESIGSPQGSFSYDDSWHHVAVTIDRENLKLYIDGELQAEKTWTGLKLPAQKSFSLGRALNRLRYFKGYLDEVVIWKRALTSEEIACLHHCGLYRYSTDGGSTWSQGWEKAHVSGEPGSTGPETITAPAVPFGQYSDKDNLINFMAMDKKTNLATAVYNVVISEEAADADTDTDTDSDTDIDTDMDGDTDTDTDTDMDGDMDTDSDTDIDTDTDTDTGSACLDDSDCPNGMVCKYGLCSKASAPSGGSSTGCGCTSNTRSAKGSSAWFMATWIAWAFRRRKARS